MKKRNRNRNRNQESAQSPVAAPPLSKADIARINGAKSHGPTSEAGKARSSQNGIKHGLTAKKFMGSPEEQAEFDLHLDAAIMHWAPKTDYELYLVTKIARADFQHDRAENFLVTLVDMETDIIGPEIERAFQSMTATGALTLGYKSLDEHSSAHRNLDRHIARLARERVQARKALLEAIEYRQKLEAEERAAEAAQPEMQDEPTAPAVVTPIDTARRPVPPVSTEPSSLPATNPPRKNKNFKSNRPHPSPTARKPPLPDRYSRK